MNDCGHEGGLAGHEETTATCRDREQDTGAEKDEEYEGKDTHLCASAERRRHMGIVIGARRFAETTGINSGHSLIVCNVIVRNVIVRSLKRVLQEHRGWCCYLTARRKRTFTSQKHCLNTTHHTILLTDTIVHMGIQCATEWHSVGLRWAYF